MLFLQVFKEMQRVLKPGGTAYMSFSNRCFPTKGASTGRCFIGSPFNTHFVKDM
jgi:ubiquinone/menaquinone biosynthesis C-methylase UbiE